MKFNLSFKKPQSKTYNLFLILLEMSLILLTFGINLGITIYDFHLVPLIITLIGMNIWKHSIKVDNIYPIKISSDDNNNLFLSSCMIISLLLIIIFSLPLFPNILNKNQQIIGSVLIAPIVEEIIFRHYMIGRLSEVYGNNIKGTLLTIVITSLIFSLGHTYQGMFGVIGSLLKGIIFAGLYLMFKRNLVVPIITHSFHNFIISIYFS